LFHPYGSSFLESARRTWRQLVMLEDAMLVYRVVRSPERRVFYIDVSGIHPNDVPTYMETVTQTIKGNDVIDKMNGRMDLRYNAIDVNEDYFLPTRPNNLTKIDTLAGGQHVSATEDVEYIWNCVFHDSDSGHVRRRHPGGLLLPDDYSGRHGRLYIYHHDNHEHRFRRRRWWERHPAETHIQSRSRTLIPCGTSECRWFIRQSGYHRLGCTRVRCYRF
jgi:hypothetical protein